MRETEGEEPSDPRAERELGRGTARSDALTWVHLSDLHFGHGSDASQRVDQDSVTAAILRDARALTADLGAPDLVLLTGDIAFSGDAGSEYPKAAEWLGKLCAALKIRADQILPVPGNHDVDRAVARRGPARCLHELRKQTTQIDEYLEDPAHMRILWPKLEAYQSFAKQYGAPELGPQLPFWIKGIETGLGPATVIGLNTTLLSCDNEDSPETLRVGKGQLFKAIEQQPEDRLLLVLQHHPPEWLGDGPAERTKLQRFPHLLFTGHVHVAAGHIRKNIVLSDALEFAAGAGHAEAAEGGRHAYAWGRLSEGGLDYFPRDWSTENDMFLASRIDPSNEFAQRGRYGDYVHVPLARLPSRLREWLESRASESSPKSSSTPPIPSPNAIPSTKARGLGHERQRADVPTRSRGAVQEMPAPVPRQLREGLGTEPPQNLDETADPMLSGLTAVFLHKDRKRMKVASVVAASVVATLAAVVIYQEHGSRGSELKEAKLSVPAPRPYDPPTDESILVANYPGYHEGVTPKDLSKVAYITAKSYEELEKGVRDNRRTDVLFLSSGIYARLLMNENTSGIGKFRCFVADEQKPRAEADRYQSVLLINQHCPAFKPVQSMPDKEQARRAVVDDIQKQEAQRRGATRNRILFVDPISTSGFYVPVMELGLSQFINETAIRCTTNHRTSIGAVLYSHNCLMAPTNMDELRKAEVVDEKGTIREPSRLAFIRLGSEIPRSPYCVRSRPLHDEKAFFQKNFDAGELSETDQAKYKDLYKNYIHKAPELTCAPSKFPAVIEATCK